jgi:ATP-dependent RNA helicase RhlE
VTQFTDFGLNPLLTKALAAKGYSEPTPIQAQAIPGVMTGRDLLGIAQTGTGKTAAFALPILHRLALNRKAAPRKGCRCLVLSPTRELATQIADSFRAYGAELGFSVATVFGGVAHNPQIKALAKGVDIIVAAPGRLLDHLGEKDADLSGVEILVLDEADQMLDMGFIVPIRKIIRHLPKDRQTLFFSATMPADIGKLAGEMLRDPLQVSVTPPATTVERINQQVVFLDAKAKRGLLVELFSRPDFTRVLVFTRTKRGADKVARVLEGAGVQASAIHGNKSQNQREKALAAFKAGEVRALVATDIAARGIDISSVSHVVQFELPDVPEQYVHRIGRTARAGNDGSAVAMCAEDERSLLRDIEKVTRQKIPSIDRRGDPVLAQLAAASPEGKAEVHIDPRSPRGQRNVRRSGEGRPQQSRGEGRGEGGRGQQRNKPRGEGRGPQRAGGGGRDQQRNEGRGERAETRGEARSDNRSQPRADQRQPERAAAGEGQPSRGRRRGGQGGGKGGSAGWSGVEAKSGNRQPQREGARPGNGERNAQRNGKPRGKSHPNGREKRNDVLAAPREHTGPATTARDLMRFLTEGRQD